VHHCVRHPLRVNIEDKSSREMDDAMALHL